jgi:hypothetical protein
MNQYVRLGIADDELINEPGSSKPSRLRGQYEPEALAGFEGAVVTIV